MKIRMNLLDLLDTGVMIHQISGRMEAIRILNVKFPPTVFKKPYFKIADQEMDFYDEELVVVADIGNDETLRAALASVKVPFTVLGE